MQENEPEIPGSFYFAEKSNPQIVSTIPESRIANSSGGLPLSFSARSAANAIPETINKSHHLQGFRQDGVAVAALRPEVGAVDLAVESARTRLFAVELEEPRWKIAQARLRAGQSVERSLR